MSRPVPFPIGKGINRSSPSSDIEDGELSIARNAYYSPESDELLKVGGRAACGSLGEPLTGLSWVKFNNGNEYLVTATRSGVSVAPPGAGATWTNLSTAALSGGGRMTATYVNATNRVYITDGVNPVYVWAGGSTVREAGLEAPSAATVAFVDNSQTMYRNGTTYLYCHTEYDSTTDVESPPSAAVAVSATAADGSFTYTFPTTQTNPGDFDKYRVYRTQNGGTVFYRLAEVANTSTVHYDGGGATAPETENNDYWGFASVDDIFLSTQPILPMTGQPLIGNYVTVNGIPPRGTMMLFWKGSLIIAGVEAYPQDLYFSKADQPEMFPPSNFLRFENGYGDPITGVGVANDRLIVFTSSTIQRLSGLPFPTDPDYGFGIPTREEVTRDHGCVAPRTVVNFGVGMPSSALFYLSPRGPMMTDGNATVPLYHDLDWGPRTVNMGRIGGAYAVVYPRNQQVWLFVPSSGSEVNDVAWILHYHPRHAKAIGWKWTGPIHVYGDAAAASYSGVTHLFTAARNGTVYLEDVGQVDESLYDDPNGKIWFEWESADVTFGSESTEKRVERLFVEMVQEADSAPPLELALNKADSGHPLELANVTTLTPGTTTRLGTSDVQPLKTRTYRAGVWAEGTHFRLRMSELSTTPRRVADIELEVAPYGAQK